MIENENKWSQLYESCASCSKCPLHESRTNCVFGTGNKNASLMFVGEAPGEQEDLSGIPFVGRAGQLLDKFLYAVDIAREDVYIANIIKCRPPKNRDPLPEEEDACMDFLREQVKIIRPKVIVCLGRIAAASFIRDDFKISREHGQWTVKNGIMTMALYHPAALLRDPRRRPETFEDLKTLQQAIRDYCTHTY